DLVLKQSPLIEIFRHAPHLMQDNFHLMHRSVQHAPPDLTATITALREILRENGTH
ncbi:hypothetical protein K474DRAFT_1583713, partial [Panus rudis PR-1116 ss-1]